MYGRMEHVDVCIGDKNSHFYFLVLIGEMKPNISGKNCLLGYVICMYTENDIVQFLNGDN